MIFIYIYENPEGGKEHRDPLLIQKVERNIKNPKEKGRWQGTQRSPINPEGGKENKKPH